MILFERGRIVDEYLSVPEFYGPLAAGRRRRAGGEPDRRLEADGRRPGERCAGSRARRRRRPICRPRASCSRDSRRCSGIEGAETRMGGRSRARGRGQDRARVKVLLLHALAGLTSGCGCPQVGALRDAGTTSTTPRLYGRGPSIDGWAAQLLRDIDGPLVAVGASMGGYCALALARRAPERVSGMVLAGSRAEADSFERRQARDGEDRRSARRRASRRWPTRTPTSSTSPSAQEAMRDRLDLTGVAASFGGPLLVCVGDQDEIVSVDEARALAETAPSAVGSRSFRARGTSSASTSPNGSTRFCSSS